MSNHFFQIPKYSRRFLKIFLKSVSVVVNLINFDKQTSKGNIHTFSNKLRNWKGVFPLNGGELLEHKKRWRERRNSELRGVRKASDIR